MLKKITFSVPSYCAGPFLFHSPFIGRKYHKLTLSNGKALFTDFISIYLIWLLCIQCIQSTVGRDSKIIIDFIK